MPKLAKRMTAMVKNAPPPEKPLPVSEAIAILKTFNTTKFDQSVEIAMHLGIDPKQADQLVRGSIVLPHGIGKSQRVVVFAKGDKLDEAKAAGADEVGGVDLAEKIKAGWTDFEVCIATPDMMGVVGPLGKVTVAQIDDIVKMKWADLNARDVEHGRRMVEGTARSMGIDVLKE